VKFSGGKPERYSNMLGPICQNAANMSDETLEREADACVTFVYPAIDREFQKHLTFLFRRGIRLAFLPPKTAESLSLRAIQAGHRLRARGLSRRTFGGLLRLAICGCQGRQYELNF
jgi:hypothetical protein